MNLSDLQAAFPDHAVKIHTFPEEKWGGLIDCHTCAAIYRPGITLPVALSVM